MANKLKVSLMDASSRGRIAWRRKLVFSIVVFVVLLGCGYMLSGKFDARSPMASGAQHGAPSLTPSNSEVGRHLENQLSATPEKVGRSGPRSGVESVAPPTGDARQVIAQLRPRAEAGDGRAALMIHLKLHQCANQMSVNVMEDMAERFEKAGASGSQFIVDQQRIRKECESSADMLAEQGKWLELAADSGDVVAQMLYATNSSAFFRSASEMLADPDGVARYKEKANRFMSDLVSKGNVQAMMWYAGAYDKGVMVPKDPARSYAYYRLVEMSAPGTISKELMDNQARKVPSQKIAEADALARTWYSACCKR
ncbi:sel1 repeat family protein [Lysobacter capsici]|uniref:sel1 repeat family protein n=1 Tax=Lysobacter capsici TaxID=435897 RepID=UPI00129041B9|nr:sel1 repeat family protein [Lysobacter capsici]